jgi:hypothetical protein
LLKQVAPSLQNQVERLSRGQAAQIAAQPTAAGPFQAVGHITRRALRAVRNSDVRSLAAARGSLDHLTHDGAVREQQPHRHLAGRARAVEVTRLAASERKLPVDFHVDEL